MHETAEQNGLMLAEAGRLVLAIKYGTLTLVVKDSRIETLKREDVFRASEIAAVAKRAS